MAFNSDADFRMLAEKSSIPLYRTLLIITNIRLIEIEVDVLHVLCE